MKGLKETEKTRVKSVLKNAGFLMVQIRETNGSEDNGH